MDEPSETGTLVARTSPPSYVGDLEDEEIYDEQGRKYNSHHC